MVYNIVQLSNCKPVKNWMQVMLHYFWTTLYMTCFFYVWLSEKSDLVHMSKFLNEYRI